MIQLPILEKEREILETVHNNQVTIVVGETGSGKTTQIPVFLYGDSYAEYGQKIGITQPRRIAATSVAAFVANQIGTGLGDVVGYQIRFDDHTASDTQVKFMTDGILLQEIQADPDLGQYSVIVVDEAHERSENIDFLLGLLKDLLKRRSDLKIIVTSATIDERKFSRYFGDAPIVNVSGRMHPVDIVWSDINYSEREISDAVVGKVAEIHKSQPAGDILVFMTGRDDIMAVISGLEKLGLNNLIPLPVYGELSTEDQQKIFNRYFGKRKVVVATNIAETSITVDGIAYVVDSGLIKQSNFHPDTGIASLDVTEHSQAGCDQRAGRAGRVQSGICYRMYTQDNFRQRLNHTTPEILRVSLADVVLKMENLGIDDIEKFDFIDPPDREAFHEAYETLIALGAIQRGVKGLTDIGCAMAQLPLDPRISRMLLEAEKYGCVKDVATVAAFLSVRNVFVRPKDNEWEADEAHMKFKDDESDAITFLNVWRHYEVSGFDNSWCFSNFLHARTMREVGKIRKQLHLILRHSGIELTEINDPRATVKAVAMGLVYNLFQHVSRGGYRGVLRENAGVVRIHPSSGLFRGFRKSQFIVVTEIIRTNKVWGRVCTAIDEEWLPEMVPHLCSVSEPVIESWNPGEETVEVSSGVLFRDIVIKSLHKIVSLEDAIQIQNKNIKKAEQEGYIYLSFRKRSSGYLTEWVADHNGLEYKTFQNVQEGITYLCKLENSFGNRDYVRQVVRLFNFPSSSSAAVATPSLVDAEFENRMTINVGVQSAMATTRVNGSNFTEMGSRWFRCSCGVSARISKDEWKQYQSGTGISLECDSCNLSDVIQRG